jgi:glycosyltransferase involved in cell wall biosynthesis
MAQKYKILMFSDHLLSTSGVGTQSRYLATKLIETGKYTIRQFGAAIRHESYDNITVNEDLIIKPIDGFGSPELIRVALATEKPDAVMIFNDPRFFIHFWEMEDEIHQVCPIVYWHLWDDCQFPPTYNKLLYDNTDLINCINRPTYDFLKPLYPEKVNWVPHAVPKELFKPLPDEVIAADRKLLLQGRPDDTLVVLWVARNAPRKRPGDLVWAWKLFLDELEKKHGHRKALLVMHCDPLDMEGSNLFQVIDMFGVKENVMFSNDKVGFQDMTRLYNACDTTINRSSAEGFGLPILETMMCGKPVIAIKTGGLTRQVVDWRDDSENGIALPVELSSMNGSQSVPYILDNFVSNETVVKALMQMYEYGPEKRKELGKKAMEYAHFEYDLDALGKAWDESLEDCIKNWKSRYKRWEKVTL